MRFSDRLMHRSQRLLVYLWTKKLSNTDFSSIYGFYTHQKSWYSHLLKLGSGSGPRHPDPSKKVRIRPDPDPQLWLGIIFLLDTVSELDLTPITMLRTLRKKAIFFLFNIFSKTSFYSTKKLTFWLWPGTIAFVLFPNQGVVSSNLDQGSVFFHRFDPQIGIKHFGFWVMSYLDPV
jgi:hypothetical protein